MSAVLSAARRLLGGRGRAGVAAEDGHAARRSLPDPAKPPENRGRWESAALINVDITEEVKRQIHTRTRPWEK